MFEKIFGQYFQLQLGGKRERNASSSSSSSSSSLAPTNSEILEETRARGMLTKRGAWDLQVVGRQLRERYRHHFSFLQNTPCSDTNPDSSTYLKRVSNTDGCCCSANKKHQASLEELQRSVHARSTGTPRTVQSLQNLLAGLLIDDMNFNFIAPPSISPSSPSTSPTAPSSPQKGAVSDLPEGLLNIHVRRLEDESLFPNGKVSALRFSLSFSLLLSSLLSLVLFLSLSFCCTQYTIKKKKKIRRRRRRFPNVGSR
tara:strand:+ start:378 stop:1145 length:768 start_codon:yes stop_codon:yes gene_type:complete